MSLQAPAEWIEFLTFLGGLGEVGVGLTGPILRDLLVQSQEATLPVFMAIMQEGNEAEEQLVVVAQGAQEAPESRGPLGALDDPSEWSEPRRRDANLVALRALRALDGLAASGPARLSLLGYSGWGGIKISDLPLDPTAFDEEFIEAIRGYKEKSLTAPRIFGLQHQYFTPLMVCQAAWRVVGRIRDWLGTPIRSALEPSAGIGRMLQTSSIRDDLWTCIEADEELARMLKALYPDARVHRALFEEWIVAGGVGGFDVIAGNPPYGDREKKYRRLDGYEWGEADAYFADRSLGLLAPGGILALVTRYSLMTGQDEESIRFRRDALRQCHFAGAVALPADIFSGAKIQTAFHFWVKRATPKEEAFTAEEQAILTGDYWGTVIPETDNLVGDEWVKGRFEGQQILRGEFDPQKFVGMRLRIMPQDEIDAALAARAKERVAEGEAQKEGEPVSLEDAIAKVKAQGAKGQRAPRALLADPTVVAAAAARVDAPEGDIAKGLAYRVGRFLRLMQDEPASAETGRAELFTDISTFLSLYSNPHQGALRADPTLAPLREVIDPHGVPAPVLTAALAPRVDEILPPDAGPGEVIRHFSRLRGVCSEADLLRTLGSDLDMQAVITRVEQTPTLAMEFRRDGTVVFYNLDDFLTGDLYHRLDLIDAVLSTVPNDDLAAKMTAQKAAVLDVLQTSVISEIEVLTPRSGFVPLPCIAAYLHHRLIEEAATKREGEPATFELKIDHGLLQYIPRVEWVEKTNREETRYLVSEAAKRYLIAFFGYWNRQEIVPDPENVWTTGTYRLGGPSTVETRMAWDKALEEDFRNWIMSNEEWRGSVEDAYNRAYRGFRKRTYDTSPVPIARMDSSVVQLKNHQNAGVRRFTDRRGGIAAWDVGSGKTLLGAATLANWRQEGHCKLGLFLVPNSVLLNWYNEIRRLLPDYRICLMGLTIEGTGDTMKVVEDTAEVRQLKWQRAAEKRYDVILCPYSKFLDDVDVKPENKIEILSKLFWLQRELGLDEQQAEITRRRIKLAEQEIKYITGEERPPYEPGKRQRHRETIQQQNEWLENYRAQIAAAEASGKPAPTWMADSIKRNEEAIKDLERQIRVIKAEISEWKKKLDVPSDRILDTIKGDIEEFAEGTEKRSSKGPLIWWEDLGVDALCVDEAHNFKNLWYPESRQGQKIEFMGAGDNSKRTLRAWDLYLKCQWLLEHNDDQGVLLMTGTPIKNSPLEVYNLLSYVSSKIWIDRGIRHAEEFIDRHVIITTRRSMNKDKGEMEERPTAIAFGGLAELRSLFDAFMDIKTMKDLPDLIVPEARVDNVDVPLDPMQASTYPLIRATIAVMKAELKEKAKGQGENAWVAGRKIGGTMALRQMDLLSKAALDLRLLVSDVSKVEKAQASGKLSEQQEESQNIRAELLQRIDVAQIEAYYKDHIPPKYTALAKRILNDEANAKKARAVLRKTKGLKVPEPLEGTLACGHIIFVDYNETHEWIREALAKELGISPKRIAIMNNKTAGPVAKRQAIAEGFNGRRAVGLLTETFPHKFDLLIGNSKIMGEGQNLQARTCAVHHLDFPWEPATITQTNGRGVRQGNVNMEVWVRYYKAPKSFDVIKLNEVLGKLSWQQSLFSETARAISNPNAEVEFDREELLIIMSSDDPEEELATHRATKKTREAEDILKRRIEYVQKFANVVFQYAKARGTKDPTRRTAEFSSADRHAALLRLTTDAVFPFKEALDRARENMTLIVPTTGMTFYVGQRFSQASGEYHSRHEAPKQVAYEVVGVEPRFSGGGTLTVRQFGQGETKQLTDAMVANIAAAPPVTFWDDHEDRAQVLKSPFSAYDIPTFDERLAVAISANLLRATMQQARSETSTWEAHKVQARRIASASQRYDVKSGVPLLGAHGDILILPTDEAQAIFTPLQKPSPLGGKPVLVPAEDIAHAKDVLDALVSGYRYMIPQDRANYPKFLRALREDQIREIAGSASVQAGRIIARPLDLHLKPTVKLLTDLVAAWFPGYLPPDIIAEALKRRSHTPGRSS